MSQTGILVILVTAILTAQSASASLITMQHHILDTGMYVPGVGDNAPQLINTPSNGVLDFDEVGWKSSIENPIITTVTILDLIHLKVNDSIEFTLANALIGTMSTDRPGYAKVSKPYPGWITSVSNSTELPFIIYVGKVTSTEFMLVMTHEDSDKASYILQNLKVYPIANRDALTIQKVAEDLQ